MHIDWEIVVRLVQALAWPVVVLVVAFQARPLVLQILSYLPGARISAAGINVEIRADEAVVRAKEEVGPEAVEGQKAELDLHGPREEQTPAQLYDAVMSAWHDLTEAMRDVYSERTGFDLDWRSAHGSIDALAQSGILNRKTADAVRQLLSVRAQAKRRGPGGFEDLGISADEVRDYVATAKTLQLRIQPEPQ